MQNRNKCFLFGNKWLCIVTFLLNFAGEIFM